MSVAAALMLVGAGCLGAGTPPAENPGRGPSPEPVTEEESSVAEEESVVSFTLEEVAEHVSADDCWLAIDGKVYDASGSASKHPGGDALLEGCGKDATELFETRPMGSGTPHSQGARKGLEKLYIGELAQ